MLYWAEGRRADSDRVHKLGSTSWLLFRRFLTDALAIDLDEISMSLNVYTTNGLTIEEIELLARG